MGELSLEKAVGFRHGPPYPPPGDNTHQIHSEPEAFCTIYPSSNTDTMYLILSRGLGMQLKSHGCVSKMQIEKKKKRICTVSEEPPIPSPSRRGNPCLLAFCLSLLPQLPGVHRAERKTLWPAVSSCCITPLTEVASETVIKTAEVRI